MKRNEPISKIMTTDVRTVHTGQKLSEVRRMLADSPYHHAPVVDGTKLVGMISATDMVRLSLEVYGLDDRAVDAMLDSQHTVEGVMTKGLSTIGVRDTVRDAAEILTNASFHALPVVDDGDLVGIVTTTDIIQYLLDQY